MTTQSFPHISSDRLALLYNLSQAFNSSLNLNEVLNTVIDEVIAAVSAERGFVVLLEDGEMVFPAARGINQTNIDDPQFQVSRGVINQVIEEGEPVLTSNAQVDERFSGMQSVAFLGLSSVMSAPLKTREKTFGAVYVESRVQTSIFTEDDLDMLNSIASSAAIAIENARLYEVAVEKGRMERELNLGREVQNSFLPAEMHQIPDWEINAYLQPARQVSGDFYDVFPIPGSELIGLVVGDVCDKGVPAALFMALFRSLIRAFVHQHCSNGVTDRVYENPDASGGESQAVFTDPGSTNLIDTINLTNDYIANFHGHTNMFATVFFGLLDPTSGTLMYINGGHEPPILAGERGMQRLDPTGPALGLFPDQVFLIESVEFQPQDTFLVFTDGAYDALNSQGERFTEERLVNLVQSHNSSTENLLDRVADELRQYIADREQFDDITLLAVRRKK